MRNFKKREPRKFGLNNKQRMSRSQTQIDTTIEIVTPENISFKYEVAGPFRRVPAFLMDVAVRFLFQAGLLIALVSSGLSDEFVLLAMAVSYFVLEWFYGGILETYWNGQTVGKRIMGIRVLSADGQPINGLQGIMRNVLRLADLMPILPLTAWGTESPAVIPTGTIGLIVPLLNNKYQRLGDVVCGTIVVAEERQQLFPTTRFDDPRVAQLAADIPGSLVLGAKTAQALAAYAERRRFLSPSRRAEIARHIAEPMLRQLDLPSDTNHDLLMCALYYRTFVAEPMEEQQAETGWAGPVAQLSTSTAKT
jgi:uncharacterized RDD family membrane protein YckC